MQLTLILFPIALAIYGAIIYLFVLLVKALRKYIKSKDVRKEKKAVCRSLGEALKAHRTEKQMTQEFVAETLGVSRPAVITPYPEATNVIEKAFLEANGLTVTNIVDMNKQRLWVPLIEPTYVYQQIKKMDLNGADSIFISCTGLNILSMIPIIEEDFGLPVITSNQASIWASLRYARIGAKNPKLGKLMREF